MKCRKYKGLANKNVSENKAFLEKEDNDSRAIGKKFKKSTKITKKL